MSSLASFLVCKYLKAVGNTQHTLIEIGREREKRERDWEKSEREKYIMMHRFIIYIYKCEWVCGTVLQTCSRINMKDSLRFGQLANYQMFIAYIYPVKTSLVKCLSLIKIKILSSKRSSLEEAHLWYEIVLGKLKVSLEV